MGGDPVSHLSVVPPRERGPFDNYPPRWTVLLVGGYDRPDVYGVFSNQATALMYAAKWNRLHADNDHRAEVVRLGYSRDLNGGTP